MEKFIRGRTFFVTAERYMGLAPEATRSGDLVCVIFGCQLPFIVREDAGQHLLVGECYAQGLMGGESMDVKHIAI